MTDAQIALARAVVAWSPWEWSAGMRAIDKDGHRWRILANVGGPGHHAQGEGHSGYTSGWETIADLLGAVPDLTDPPTVGAMLALFRRVKDLPSAYVMPAYSGIEDCDLWRVTVPRWQPRKRFPTEGEAIAYALLECP